MQETFETFEKFEMLKETCERIVDSYIRGTPNGIHMDSDSALVWSPSHFTWMDTNYPACTPRIGYPVEIQALWISALKFVGRVDLVQKATDSLLKYFRWEHGFRDCLAAPNGESAANATLEDTIRPNQLLLVTLGIARAEGVPRTGLERQRIPARLVEARREMRMPEWAYCAN